MKKQNTPGNAQRMSYTRLDEVAVFDDYIANAAAKERKYLLSLDADRLLYRFRTNAGLLPKASAPYGGGWENGLIGGHTLGHYLSALSQASACACTPESERALLLSRVAYIVDELQLCQAQAGIDNEHKPASASASGFLWGACPTKTGGMQSLEYQFDAVEREGNGYSDDAWVPWYTMHKLLQGLIDAAQLTQSDEAYEVLIDLADWVCRRVDGWTDEVRDRVLGVEYGGMNDVLYRLFDFTWDIKYVRAAQAFDDETLFARVREGRKDYLNGVHANTTIPKILGALSRYVYCHGKTIGGAYIDASEHLETAKAFWAHVVAHHTYVTGGHSENEHFGADDALDAARTACNCETCNTYNMLKLSRALFAITGESKYLDYYENTYYNAILSSQNPDTGMTMYFQPMATGYFKVYGTPEDSFWCCTGTGMESFTKPGDGIYYHARPFVTCIAMYIDSRYVGKDVSLRMKADLAHGDEVHIAVEKGKTLLHLRKPYWSDRFDVTLDGKPVRAPAADGFVRLAVTEGEQVHITLRKRIRAYALADGKDAYAFLYGPFALSAELGGQEMRQEETGVHVAIPSPAPAATASVRIVSGTLDEFTEHIDSHFTRTSDGKFLLEGVEPPLVYSLHYRQHTERYGLYMRFRV